jgi:hypothetical protein
MQDRCSFKPENIAADREFIGPGRRSTLWLVRRPIQRRPSKPRSSRRNGESEKLGKLPTVGQQGCSAGPRVQSTDIRNAIEEPPPRRRRRHRRCPFVRVASRPNYEVMSVFRTEYSETGDGRRMQIHRLTARQLRAQCSRNDPHALRSRLVVARSVRKRPRVIPRTSDLRRSGPFRPTIGSGPRRFVSRPLPLSPRRSRTPQRHQL